MPVVQTAVQRRRVVSTPRFVPAFGLTLTSGFAWPVRMRWEKSGGWPPLVYPVEFALQATVCPLIVNVSGAGESV